MQDVDKMTKELPPHPQDLRSTIVFTKKLDTGTFQFRARAYYIKRALLWLKNNNKYYKHITISNDNMSAYPDDSDISEHFKLIEMELHDDIHEDDNIISNSFIPHVLTIDQDAYIDKELHLRCPDTSTEPIN